MSDRKQDQAETERQLICDIFERCATIAHTFGIGRERASYGGSDIAVRIRADMHDYLASRALTDERDKPARSWSDALEEGKPDWHTRKKTHE